MSSEWGKSFEVHLSGEQKEFEIAAPDGVLTPLLVENLGPRQIRIGEGAQAPHLKRGKSAFYAVVDGSVSVFGEDAHVRITLGSSFVHRPR